MCNHYGPVEVLMNTAWYERMYGRPYEWDSRDNALLEQRRAARTSLVGPSVGDFLSTSKGLMRFTHDWGDSLQTTVPHGGTDPMRPKGCESGSFYISQCGGMSFSGSLDPAIPKDRIESTGEIREGACWFFSHDMAEANNGIYATVPCRVYRLKE